MPFPKYKDPKCDCAGKDEHGNDKVKVIDAWPDAENNKFLDGAFLCQVCGRVFESKAGSLGYAPND